MYLAQGDILSAFDYMNHQLAAESMLAAGWSKTLVATIHFAHNGIYGKTRLMGLEVNDFMISKRYKQGTIEGPKVWKTEMTYLLSMLVP